METQTFTKTKGILTVKIGDVQLYVLLIVGLCLLC